MTRTQAKRSSALDLSGGVAPDEVQSVVDRYAAVHGSGLEHKKESYQQLVNHYYDLVTDFYEWGWGKNFHFAPRRRGESFRASQVRFHHRLADELCLKPGMEILDAGCGVGGPMGNLARYCGASFVGINLNAYQIERAKIHTADVGELCSFIHGDYMRIPRSDGHFDGAVSVEAIAHAPDKIAAYSEIFRVLRPGAGFAGTDWCLTDLFDPSNPAHMRVKEGIMTGAGLPDIVGTTEVCDALRTAGFELMETHDLAVESDPATPWYRALQGRDFSLASIPRTPFGRTLTNLTLRAAERLRLAPEGARAVSTFLNRGADTLVDGGRTGIFTPMFFFLARKPLAPGD